MNKINSEPSLGMFLKLKRVSLKFSLEDLAKELGCSKSTISLFERERAIPSQKFVIKLAKALCIDLKHLTKMVTIARLEGMKEIQMDQKMLLIRVYKGLVV